MALRCHPQSTSFILTVSFPNRFSIFHSSKGADSKRVANIGRRMLKRMKWDLLIISILILIYLSISDYQCYYNTFEHCWLLTWIMPATWKPGATKLWLPIHSRKTVFSVPQQLCTPAHHSSVPNGLPFPILEKVPYSSFILLLWQTPWPKASPERKGFISVCRL